MIFFLHFLWPQVLLRVSWNLSLGVYISLSLMALVATLLLPYETKGRAMQVSHAADKSFYRGFFSCSVLVCNPFESSSVLVIFVSFRFIITNLVFVFLSKLLFRGFLRLEDLFCTGKTDLIYRDMFRDIHREEVALL